jgi:hypothetical protein
VADTIGSLGARELKKERRKKKKKRKKGKKEPRLARRRGQ